MSAREPCRVLVADDAADVRQLLCVLLDIEEDFTIVGQAADGAEAVRLTEQCRPDLVVIDLSMPGMDGLQAVPEIRRINPASKLVIFSGFETTTVEQVAQRLGADGYIEKGSDVDLVQRLRAIYHGRHGADVSA